MHAIGRSLRITSKKINLIADLVRNKDILTAINLLKFTPKKGAKILGKIVKSAVANAENNFKQNKNSLFIKEIIVTEGSTLKRSVPVSRGRTHPILKRTAHATVRLGILEKPEPKKTEEKPKEVEKKDMPSTEKKTSAIKRKKSHQFKISNS